MGDITHIEKAKLEFYFEDRFRAVMAIILFTGVAYIISNSILISALVFLFFLLLAWKTLKRKIVFKDDTFEVQNNFLKKDFFIAYSDIISVTVSRLITKNTNFINFKFTFTRYNKKDKLTLSIRDEKKAKELLNYLHSKNLSIAFGNMDPELKWWIEPR